MINKVLVTGGTGYIGSNLVKELCKRRYEVSVITRKNSKLCLLEDVLEKVNICIHDGTNESMKEIVGRIKPDLVIHLAGTFISEHKADDIEMLIKDNIIFGSYLLEAMKENNVYYFINTGTNWRRCHALNDTPVNLYAATKEAYSKIAEYYVDSQAMRMITLNLLDTYGPFDPRKKVVNLLKDIANNGEKLEMSAGEQELGLVYIDDVIKAFLCAIDKLKKMECREIREYCVAPKENVTLKKLVEIFEEIYSKKLNVELGKRPYRFREVMAIENQYPNILEDEEIYSINEGIATMIKFEKNKLNKKEF